MAAPPAHLRSGTLLFNSELRKEPLLRGDKAFSTVPLLRYLPDRGYGYPEGGGVSSTTLNLRFSSVQGNRLLVQLLYVVLVLVDCTYGLELESRANTALSVSQRVLARRSYALTAGLQRLRRFTQRW